MYLMHTSTHHPIGWAGLVIIRQHLRRLCQWVLLACCAWGASEGLARAMVEVDSATNRDGSAVRVRTVTDEAAGLRHVGIYFRKAAQTRMQRIARHTYSLNESPAIGITQIVDWDRNGTHELSVTMGCGAGPNCETTLWHIDPATAQLVPLFSGGGDVFYLNGYLVDFGRNNCCSWEASVHAVSPDRLRIDPTPTLYVYTGLRETSTVPPQTLTLQGKGSEGEALICYFYTRSPSGQATLMPPPAGLRRLCRWSDDQAF
jgi:hypothetical protein